MGLPFLPPVKPRFNFAALLKLGPAAVHDPSSLWGASDHLPRRNLLTYSEDFSNATYWTPTSTTWAAGVLTATAGASAHRINQNTTFNVAYLIGTSYLSKWYIKKGTHNYVQIVNSSGAFGTESYANFDLNAGSVGTVGANCTAAISGPDGSGYYTITLTGVATASTSASPILYMIPASNSARAASWTAVGTETVSLMAAMLSTTATTDQSYQKVTDWTTEQYAWAASKNVPWLRRNLLTNTVFANSGGAAPTSWSQAIGTGTSAPDGNDGAGNVIYSQSATAQRPFLSAPGTYTLTANTTYALSMQIHTVSGLIAQDVLRFSSVPSGATVSYPVCAANPSGGNGGTLQAGRAEIRIAVGATAGTTSIYCGMGVNGATTGSLRFSSPQLEIASAATAYQPIGASWEATYAANAAAAGVVPTMYQDSAGTTPVTGPDTVVGKLVDLSGGGYHAVQSGATGLKPILKLSPNGYWYIQRDLSDDALVTTFPNLGTACASYINDGSTVTETTGLTLNGALTQNTPAADYGRVYLNAPSPKAAQLIKWLKAKAGLV